MGTQAADRLGDIAGAEMKSDTSGHGASDVLTSVEVTASDANPPALRTIGGPDTRWQPADPSTGVLDTSELRWFAGGLLARDVAEWFTCGGIRGSVEERCDTYQLTGLSDLGVKRRAKETLEVKALAAVGDGTAFAEGLDTDVEEWRKWTPGPDEARWRFPKAAWVDVHKVVLTRLFTPSGEELSHPAHHPGDLPAGCEVELVALRVGAINAWTLAFEAFGPHAIRSSALTAAWEALTADSPPPEDLGSHFTLAAGYPQWLDLLAPQPLAISG